MHMTTRLQVWILVQEMKVLSSSFVSSQWNYIWQLRTWGYVFAKWTNILHYMMSNSKVPYRNLEISQIYVPIYISYIFLACWPYTNLMSCSFLSCEMGKWSFLTHGVIVKMTRVKCEMDKRYWPTETTQY